MDELENERAAAIEIIEEVPYLCPVAWENTGASPQSAEDVYLREVHESDIYLGIFGKEYSRASIVEYKKAEEWNKDIFIYIKNIFKSEREDKLSNFISKVKKEHTISKFRNVTDLTPQINKDLHRHLIRFYRVQSKKFKRPKSKGPDHLYSLVQMPNQDTKVTTRKKHPYDGKEELETKLQNKNYPGILEVLNEIDQHFAINQQEKALIKCRLALDKLSKEFLNNLGETSSGNFSKDIDKLSNIGVVSDLRQGSIKSIYKYLTTVIHGDTENLNPRDVSFGIKQTYSEINNLIEIEEYSDFSD